MAWSQLRLYSRRLSTYRYSDNQLSYEIKQLVGQRPTPPAMPALLRQVSQQIDTFRPKACATLLHSLSKISSPESRSAARVLIDRFQLLCQQKPEFTASDLAKACNGLSHIPLRESKIALALAVNRVSEMSSSLPAAELIICLFAFIRSEVPIERAALSALTARILQLIEQMSVGNLITAAIFCAQHAEASEALPIVLKRIASLASKLDAENLAAIASSIPRAKIPADLWMALEKRALRIADRANPPALPILLHYFAKSGLPGDHNVIKALLRRSVIIINRFNPQDLAMVMQAVTFHSVFDLRAFGVHAAAISPDLNPDELSSIIKGLNQLPRVVEDDERLIENILFRAEELISQCSTKQVAMLAHSISGLKMGLNDKLRHRFADQIKAKLHEMNTIDLSSLARSSVLLGLESETIRQIVNKISKQSSSMNQSEMRNVLWAIPRWKLDSRTDRLVAIAQRTRELLESAHSHTLALCAHAMSEIEIFSQIVPHDLILRLSTQSAAKFRSGELVLLLTSLYKLKPQPLLYSHLCVRLQELIPEMTDERLVAAFWNFVSARFDAGDVLQDMITSCSRFVPNLSVKDLVKLMHAVSFSQINRCDQVIDAVVDSWLQRVDLKDQSHLNSAILFALACTDSAHIAKNQIECLWSPLLNEFEEQFVCYDPDQRNAWLTQLWLAFQWCQVRYPDVMGALDSAKSQNLASVTRNVMLSESPMLASDDVQLQQEIAEALRKAFGKDRVQFEFQCPSTGYLIDIVLDDKWAIEVDGASHYFGDRLNGPTKLKTLLLTQAGWKVHRIPTRDWINSTSDQLGLIRRKLNGND